VASLAMFIVWIVTSCSLGIALASNLSVYGSNGRSVEYIEIASPPDTLYIKIEKRITPEQYKYSMVEDYEFWEDEQNNRIFGNANLHIYNRDDNKNRIVVNKSATSIINSDADKIARELEYGINLSGDTLYIDEYYVQPGSRWMGSEVDVNVNLPIGTVIKPVEKTDLSILRYFDENSDAPYFWIVEYGLSTEFNPSENVTPSDTSSKENGMANENSTSKEMAPSDQAGEITSADQSAEVN